MFFIQMTNERSFGTELCMWESHRFNVAIFHLKDLSITCLYSYINLYSIVASTNTCYYSENQIFCFLKSRIVTCRFFLGEKLFCLLLDLLDIPTTWQKHDVCQVAGISKRFDNFYFLTPHVTNWIKFGVSLNETSFC